MASASSEQIYSCALTNWSDIWVERGWQRMIYMKERIHNSFAVLHKLTLLPRLNWKKRSCRVGGRHRLLRLATAWHIHSFMYRRPISQHCHSHLRWSCIALVLSISNIAMQVSRHIYVGLVNPLALASLSAVIKSCSNFARTCSLSRWFFSSVGMMAQAPIHSFSGYQFIHVSSVILKVTIRLPRTCSSFNDQLICIRSGSTLYCIHVEISDHPPRTCLWSTI